MSKRRHSAAEEALPLQDMGQPQAGPSGRTARATTVVRKDQENEGDLRNMPAEPNSSAPEPAQKEPEGPCPNRCGSHKTGAWHGPSRWVQTLCVPWMPSAPMTAYWRLTGFAKLAGGCSRCACMHYRRKEDPVGWLRFQKRRWRDTAAARKRRRLEAAQQRDRGPPGPQPAPRGDLPALITFSMLCIDLVLSHHATL